MVATTIGPDLTLDSKNYINCTKSLFTLFAPLLLNKRLFAIYSLITLYWYCTIFGTTWVLFDCSCASWQLAVYMQRPGFSE